MVMSKHRRRAGKRGEFHHIPIEDYPAWPQEDYPGPGYAWEDELCDQIAKLPTEQQVAELCSVLRVATLRELSWEIVNGGIDHLKGNTGRLEYAKLLNSWIATAEETIAAGRNLNRIAGRRK